MKINEIKSFLRIPVIYGIHNTVTNKWYIGSCLDMKDRFQRHRYYLKHGKHHSSKLQRSFNLYGENAFDVQILKHLSEDDDRFILEEEYIKKYNSINNGYNILETCKEVNYFKLSEKAKSNFMKYIDTLKRSVICIDRFTGNIVNEFSSISDAARFYKTSSSNISRTCKGKINYIKDIVFVYKEDFDESKNYIRQTHNKGIKFSEEHKRKMGMSNPRNKAVYKYDLKGNLLEVYYSRSEAERQNSFKKEYLRTRIDKPINGYIYSYKNKDIV